MTCTFFGHKNCPKNIEPLLTEKIKYLIENCDVNRFYVGNQGGFDFLVRENLHLMKSIYKNIEYYTVLAYMPQKNDYYEKLENTIYPDGLENSPPKFAIYNRNIWMIKKSDYVITYVENPFGGAAKFKEISEKKKKIVINLI